MNAHVIYSFDEFRVDPARRELWCRGERVAVQPKAFECLAYLIEHRDRVVGTDELISAVWGSVHLTDNVVMHSIARARQAVGDNGSQQRAIRTITRVGYAWNLPVEVTVLDLPENGNVNGHASPSGDPSAPGGDDGAASRFPIIPSRPARRPILSRRWLAAAAVTFAIAIAAVLLPGGSHSPPAPVEGEAAIVLPVTVVGTSDSGGAWIRLGVMDLIAERLRELGQLVVPSDNTVALARAYIDSNGTDPHGPEDIEMLARTAAAGLVLDAQAEVIGGRWRVSLNTVHGREPAITAQGDAPDLLAAARAASDRMAVMLGFELAAVDAAAQADSRIDYVLQQARAAMLSDHFDAARELLTGLGEPHRQDPRVRYELAALDEQRGRYDDAIASYGSILSDFQPDWPSVLRAKVLLGLGMCHYRRGDAETSDARFQEAQSALNGESDYNARLLGGRIQMMMANLQAVQNRFAEAEASYARARIAFEVSGDQFALAKLDANLANLYYRMGRTEAVSYGDRGAQRLGQFGDLQNELRARVILAVAHYNQENILAAQDQVPHFERLLAQVDNPQLASSVLITKLAVLLEAGSLQEAGRMLKQIREQESSAEVDIGRIQYYDASYAHALGDYERSSASAEEAIQHDWQPALYSENGDAWLLLLRAQIALGQANKAAQVLHDASDWSSANTGDRVGVKVKVALMRGEYAAFTGDADAAVLNFDEALNLADQTRSSSELVRVVRPYTEWLIAQGDLERAGILAGRISALADRSYSAALIQLRLYHAMGEPGGWRLALERARALAGEREIPPELLEPPAQFAATP